MMANMPVHISNFSCRRTVGRTGPPEVVQEVLADLKKGASLGGHSAVLWNSRSEPLTASDERNFDPTPDQTSWDALLGPTMITLAGEMFENSCLLCGILERWSASRPRLGHALKIFLLIQEPIQEKVGRRYEGAAHCSANHHHRQLFAVAHSCGCEL